MLIQLLVYAVIALFILWRLYETLGTGGGFGGGAGGSNSWWASKKDAGSPIIDVQAEPVDEDASGKPKDKDGAKPAPAAEVMRGGANPNLSSGLAQLQKIDPSFQEKSFLVGAEGAFKLIVEGYAKGDLPAIQPYVTTEMAKTFADDRHALEAAGQRYEQTLHEVRQATIDQIWLQGNAAFVRVRFVSEQTTVVYDRAQSVVEGDPATPVVLEDLWTFTRPLNNKTPQWWLCATEEPEEEG
jgi:predicted lipid-binding transport protein (Tim44 family)